MMRWLISSEDEEPCGPFSTRREAVAFLVDHHGPVLHRRSFRAGGYEYAFGYPGETERMTCVYIFVAGTPGFHRTDATPHPIERWGTGAEWEGEDS